MEWCVRYLFRSSHFRTPSRQSFIRSQSTRSESSNPVSKSDVPVPASDAWLATDAALFKYDFHQPGRQQKGPHIREYSRQCLELSL